MWMAIELAAVAAKPRRTPERVGVAAFAAKDSGSRKRSRRNVTGQNDSMTKTSESHINANRLRSAVELRPGCAPSLSDADVPGPPRVQRWCRGARSCAAISHRSVSACRARRGCWEPQCHRAALDGAKTQVPAPMRTAPEDEVLAPHDVTSYVMKARGRT